MEKVKPCPFCGRYVEPDREVVSDGEESMMVYFIECECGISQTQGFRSREKSIVEWNKRSSDGCGCTIGTNFEDVEDVPVFCTLTFGEEDQ